MRSWSAGARAITPWLLLGLIGLGVTVGFALRGAGFVGAPGGDVGALSPMEAKWGIRIVAIRRSAAGYMLDLRYQVLDPDKAADFVDRGIKPELLVEKSGARLQVPVTGKIGPLRQSALRAKAGKIYFMFFANPARHVQAGDTVTLSLGEFELRHLRVQ